MCLAERVPGCPQLAFARSPPLVGPSEGVLSMALSLCLSSLHPMIPNNTPLLFPPPHQSGSILPSQHTYTHPTHTHTPPVRSLSVNFHRHSMLGTLTGCVIRASSHCHGSPSQHFISLPFNLSLILKEFLLKTAVTVFPPWTNIHNILKILLPYSTDGLLLLSLRKLLS